MLTHNGGINVHAGGLQRYIDVYTILCCALHRCAVLLRRKCLQQLGRPWAQQMAAAVQQAMSVRTAAAAGVPAHLQCWSSPRHPQAAAAGQQSHSSAAARPPAARLPAAAAAAMFLVAAAQAAAATAAASH
jgi:hypothetical protein